MKSQAKRASLLRNFPGIDIHMTCVYLIINMECYSIDPTIFLTRFALNKSDTQHLQVLLILFEKVQSKGSIALVTVIGIIRGMGSDCLWEKAMQCMKS